mgnify:FL=1
MKSLDPTQYTGRERAAASLQQKLLFGAEAGPAVGGITAFIGPALKGTAKVAGKTLSPITKTVDKFAFSPLAKVVASERTGIPQMLKAINSGRVTLGEKMGIPEYKKWRFMDTESTSMKESLFAKADEYFVAPIRTSGTGPEGLTVGLRETENFAEEFKTIASKYVDNLERGASSLAKEMGKTGKSNTKVFVNELVNDAGKYATGTELDKLNPNLVKFKTELDGIKNNFDDLRNHARKIFSTKELESLFRKDLNTHLLRTFDITSSSSFKVPKAAKENVSGIFSRMLRNDPEFKFKSKEEIDIVANAQTEELINLGRAEGRSTEDLVKETQNFLAKKGYSKGKMKELEILEKNEDLPKAIRQMFGESQDAKAAIIDTIADIATHVGKKETFSKLALLGEEAGWLVRAASSEEAALKFQKNTGVNRGLVKISDVAGDKKGKKAFSPLYHDKLLDLHTTPEIARALKGQTLWSDFLLQSSVYKSFLAFKGASQLSKTVLSPTTQVRNVESAAMFALANGHFGNGASLSDAMGFVFRDIFGPDGKISVDKIAEQSAKLRRLGVTNTNIVTKEIRALTDDLIKASEDSGGKLNRTELFLKNLQDKSVLGKLTEVYQGGDNVWKAFGFEFERSKMLNIIKEPSPANPLQHIDDASKYFREVIGRRYDKFLPNGNLKTREQILDEVAAEIIKNTYSNYSYVPTLVQNLRRLPLGNFISFPAEMYRTSFNLMKFGLREMRSSDEFVRQSGAKKLIGFSSALAVGKVAQEIGKEAVGVTNEQLDAIRESFVAPWNKSGPLVPVAKEIKGDKVVYKFVNFAYQSPYDVIAAPYYAAMTQFQTARAEEKDIDQAMLRAFFGSGRDPGAFTALVQPFVGEAIITEKLADLFVRGGKTRSGRKILSEEDTVSDIAVKGVVHLLEGITPGAFTQATNFARGIAGEQTTYGKDMNPGDEALALFAGIRINEANVGKSMGYQVNNFVSSQREARRLLTKNFGDANLNAETVYREYEKMLRNKFENFAEIRKVFDDAQKLGFRKQFIFPLIERRLTKRDRGIVFRGVFFADKIGTLFNDARFKKTLRDRGQGLTDFIDLNRMREIFNRYNGRRFGQGL